METPRYPEKPVLLVDDEPMILLSFGTILRKAGMDNFMTIEDSREVAGLLDKHEFAAIVLDLTMPHVTGREILENIRLSYPDIPVIVATADDDIETAIDCMKNGAFDYLVKPVEMNRFVSSVKKALELSALANEVASLKNYLIDDHLENESSFSEIITENKKMRSLFQYAEAIAVSNEPVLITGETGTGKELFSRAIHKVSRRKGSLIALNISGLDDTMFSDSLFGHRKGAYTGADTNRDGLIAQAAGGTLFLDEIGDLSELSQIKLLRLLQEKQYFPLGSDTPKYCEARIIVATNQDLPDLMSKNRFRKDLYFRLKSHQIHIPPLRDRHDDIPALLDHLIHAASASMSRSVTSYPRELLTLLYNYTFPGNVRELKAMVFDAVARHKGGRLSMESFREIIKHDSSSHHILSSAHDETQAPISAIFGRFPSLREIEDYLIRESLKLADNNQGIAATMLGITRQALNKRLIKQKNP